MQDHSQIQFILSPLLFPFPLFSPIFPFPPSPSLLPPSPSRSLNAYHNNATHGADVLQTVHYLVHTTGLEQWFCELELLALLLAAAIHNVDHTGTTNTFHIQS